MYQLYEFFTLSLRVQSIDFYHIALKSVPFKYNEGVKVFTGFTIVGHSRAVKGLSVGVYCRDAEFESITAADNINCCPVSSSHTVSVLGRLQLEGIAANSGLPTGKKVAMGQVLKLRRQYSQRITPSYPSELLYFLMNKFRRREKLQE